MTWLWLALLVLLFIVLPLVAAYVLMRSPFSPVREEPPQRSRDRHWPADGSEAL